MEFADDPRNLSWTCVLDECKAAGYDGIELGLIGFMPEDPAMLGDALALRDLQLIGGMVFQPFHDPTRWEEVKNAAARTCKSLVAHGAKHLVLIDSILPRRATTAGRSAEAEQMAGAEWNGFVSRFRDISRMGSEEHGLTVSPHPHAAGSMDFKAEVGRLLFEIDAKFLKPCLDTGHAHYAGFDPVSFMKHHRERLAYVHFKDIDPAFRADVVTKRMGFYKACGQGIFFNLGKGMTELHAVRQLPLDTDCDGWCTVEQDCDPAGSTIPVDDARANRAYLNSIGF